MIQPERGAPTAGESAASGATRASARIAAAARPRRRARPGPSDGPRCKVLSLRPRTRATVPSGQELALEHGEGGAVDGRLERGRLVEAKPHGQAQRALVRREHAHAQACVATDRQRLEGELARAAPEALARAVWPDPDADVGHVPARRWPARDAALGARREEADQRALLEDGHVVPVEEPDDVGVPAVVALVG